MQTKKIGIIGGNGIVGSFFEQFFIAQGCPVETSFLGSKLSNEYIVKNSDVVLFAVRPMSIVPELILELRHHIPTGLNPLWIDCTSYQGLAGHVVEAIRPNFSFLGAHPQCRPPKSGTLKGSKLLVTSHPHFPQPEAAEWIHWCFTSEFGFLTATEAEVIEIGYVEHDRLLATEKMLTHSLASVMAQTIVSEEFGVDISRLLQISGPFFKTAFALMCRHLSSGSLGTELITNHPESKKLMYQLRSTISNMEAGTDKEILEFLKLLPKKIGAKHVTTGDKLFQEFAQVIAKVEKP